MTTSRAVLALAGACVALGGCAGLSRLGPADLVIVNARVWTGTGRQAEAVAIREGRIVAVGSCRHVQRFVNEQTSVIDADGRRVIPGITDSHIHLVSGGLHLGRLNLRDVDSREAFIDAVAAAAKALRPGEWLQGGRWSVESWDDPTPPRKEWIDPVTPNTPVLLSRMDGHQSLANSVALRLAGIDADGPSDPSGGVIERDSSTGEPTGILKDAAAGLVSRLIPPTSEADLDAALVRAMRHVNSFGITSVHDMSGGSDLGTMLRAHAAPGGPGPLDLGDTASWSRAGAYLRVTVRRRIDSPTSKGDGPPAAHEDKRLTVRIRKYLHVSDWRDSVDRVKNFPVDDAWLCVAGFKGYVDGSLGSRTAYMYRPYADADADSQYPGGILSEMASPPKKLRHMIDRADAAGLQSAVHAIGDEGNHIVLDAYQAVARKSRRNVPRHRIEHAQHLLLEDIPRFAELGIVASMQPFHKADDGRYAETALGSDRLAGSYAFRSLIDSGALLCFGSDWPVVTCNPFVGMAAAVTAKTLEGKTWIPQESISIEEALRAYTVSPAAAAFAESDLGTIEPGKLADMVILSQDILNVPAERIADTRAVVTITGGKVVLDARP